MGKARLLKATPSEVLKLRTCWWSCVKEFNLSDMHEDGMQKNAGGVLFALLMKMVCKCRLVQKAPSRYGSRPSRYKKC